MPVFDILCLAASYKLRGTCVAGLRTDGGGWIRPCARTRHGELYPIHYRVQGGAPRVLDVIRISFDGPHPAAHQPENWLIADAPWQLIHRGLPDDLAPLLKASLAGGPTLLGDSSSKIEFAQLTKKPAKASLALIEPENLQWAIYSTSDNLRKPRALFRLGGTSYRLPITDPAYIGTFRTLSVGTHPLEALGINPAMRILLTISLSEPFDNGYCYKLVSAIIPAAPWILGEAELPMESEEAAWIIDALVNGADPYSGEPLPLNGPLSNPDTIKALRAASAALRSPRELLDNAGKPWDTEEETRLVAAFDAGQTMKAMARAHGRTRGAIKARLIKLGKIEG
jgi:putative nucleic acid modification protein with dual OB domain